MHWSGAMRRHVGKVHPRAADEAGHEAAVGRVIKLLRRADLLDDAVVEHDDPIGERHRFSLIMRHIDHGGADIGVELGDLDPHLHAQVGIEIGQRLVEQEHVRLADQGATDGDALALAAGEFTRTALSAGDRPSACLRDIADLAAAMASRPMPSVSSAKPIFRATLICG